MCIENIDRHDIEAFVEHEQDRGLSIRAVRTRLVAVYSFIRYLVDSKVLSPELLMKKIKLKLPDSLPRAIDSNDVKLLFSVMKQPRDKALFLLLLRTGMRIGELLDLQTPDIDMGEQKILIYTGEKNSRGRVVYFSDDAKAALTDWFSKRNPAKECLFYSARNHYLTYAAVRNRFNKYLEKAGLARKGGNTRKYARLYLAQPSIFRKIPMTKHQIPVNFQIPNSNGDVLLWYCLEQHFVKNRYF